MIPRLATTLMPLMRGMDPERAHELALRALRFGLAVSQGFVDLRW